MAPQNVQNKLKKLKEEAKKLEYRLKVFIIKLIICMNDCRWPRNVNKPC